LHNTVAPLRHHQQGALELECNDDGKDHAKHRLEHTIIGWIEIGCPDAEQDFQRQIPQREGNDDGDQRGQDQDADLLEFLVERQRLERQAQIRKSFFKGIVGSISQRALGIA